MSILEAFEIVHCISDPATYGRPQEGQQEAYLVPFLLPDTPPAAAASFLLDPLPLPFLPLGRTYQFDFLPRGFFGRLLLRVASWGVGLCVYWRGGLCVQLGRERAALVYDEQAMVLDVLVLHPLQPHAHHAASPLLRILMECIGQLHGGWFHRAACERYVPCLHCLIRQKDAAKPFAFRTGRPLIPSGSSSASPSDENWDDVTLFHVSDVITALQSGKMFVFCGNKEEFPIRVSADRESGEWGRRATDAFFRRTF